MSDDEAGDVQWNDKQAADFLRIKEEDLDTAAASGAVVAIVPSTSPRAWSRRRLKTWARTIASVVGVGSNLIPKRSPGSGAPRP